MKLLVTGGMGFIPCHLVKHFIACGHEVHVADRLSYAGKWRNVGKEVPTARIWMGDLRNGDFTDRLAEAQFDAVIHAASNTHVDRAIADPVAFSLDNVVGTNQFLHSLQKYGRSVEKIIVYSTDEVFGSTPRGECFDEATMYNPSNAYSASKVGIEAICSSYYITHGLPIVVVRPCNTYGRGQHPEKAIPRFTDQALHDQPLTIHNDGTGARDWLHTSDHCAAIELLLERGVPGQSYNLARSDEHSDLEVGRLICEILEKPFRYSFVPGRPGHDRRYWMDGRKIRALGWTPSVAFQDGLRDAVLWVRDNEHYWHEDWILGVDMAVQTPILQFSESVATT